MKPIWFVLAWFFFAVGIVGAFLPILPTTPFLILSAFLFSKSSPRFHHWIMNLPVAGQGIRDWKNNRVIKPKAKLLCSLMLSLSLILIGTNPRLPLALKFSLFILLVSVGAFVVTRKSK